MALYVNHFSQKFVKANVMLCQRCHYVNEATIKSILYAIFHSHLTYICTAWSQKLNTRPRINLLQTKAMRITSFASFDAHTLPIFPELNIIKFTDLIYLYHFLYKSPSAFSHIFILTFNTHEQSTSSHHVAF